MFNKLFGKSKTEVLKHVETETKEVSVSKSAVEPVMEENVLIESFVNEEGDVQKFLRSVFEGNDNNIKRLMGELAALRQYSPAEVSRIEKYRSLGFSSKSELVEYEKLRLHRRELENELNRRLYYDRKYPINRFILDKQLQKILGKYNLVIDVVDNYVGEIPEKNLEDMMKFRIDPRDLHNTYAIEKDEWKKPGDFKLYHEVIKESSYRGEGVYKLRILAPSHMFKEGTGKKTVSELAKKMEKDPIVVCPVNRSPSRWSDKSTDGNLVVTAWGLEALDEMIFDQKMN